MHHLAGSLRPGPGHRIDRDPRPDGAGADVPVPLVPGDTGTVRVTGPGGTHDDVRLHGGKLMVLDSFRLDGKVALVTGSSRGLGQGAALALAEAGADVALLNRAAAEETAEGVRALGRRTHLMEQDLVAATPQELDESVQSVVDALGRIDILVNNAGIIRRAPLLEHPASD